MSRKTTNLFYKNKKKLKDEHFEKYGQYTCQMCGKFCVNYPKFLPFTVTIDHIIPRSKGGSDEIQNLRIACLRCNQAKGNELEERKLYLVG